MASYRISSSFAASAREKLGTGLDLLDVSSLRRLSVPRLLRTLRSHRGRPFALLLEDEASTALLPVLILLAVVAGASDVVVVRLDGPLTRVRKRDAVRALISLGSATLAVRRAARRARAELAALANAPREPSRLSGARGVLYVNANLWFGLKAGGSVGHVAGVVNALLASGHDVDVAAVAPQPLVDERAGFVALEAPGAFGMPPELNQYRFSISAAAQLRRRFRPDRHGFVYQRLSLGNYAGATVARAAGVPLVLEYNGSEVWVARHWGRPLANEELALAAESVSLRRADVVVTVSRALEDELLTRGVEPHRIVMHPNGVDVRMFDPERLKEEGRDVRRHLSIPASATVVAFLGTFGKWHGTDVLARAVRVLARDHGWLESRDVHFLLVGDGLQMPGVRTELDGVVPHRVHFTGLVPQAQAPGHLAASDVVVSPHVPNDDGSAFFGSPTKLFEYMAMGLPIVASDLDQIGEVLQPAATLTATLEETHPGDQVAVLTTPGDAFQLAEGMRWLVERPEWRATLGENARRLALERYTWDAHVAAILARVRELCG